MNSAEYFGCFEAIYRQVNLVQSDSETVASSYGRSRTISLEPTFDNKRQLTQIKVDKLPPVHDQASYLALDCDRPCDTAPFLLPPPLRIPWVSVIIQPSDG